RLTRSNTARTKADLSVVTMRMVLLIQRREEWMCRWLDGIEGVRLLRVIESRCRRGHVMRWRYWTVINGVVVIVTGYHIGTGVLRVLRVLRNGRGEKVV